MLDYFGHRRFGDSTDLVGVGANAGRGDGVSQQISVGGAEFGFGRGKLEVVLSKSLEERADDVDVGSGSGSKIMTSSR